jgi:heat shock protein HslJ
MAAAASSLLAAAALAAAQPQPYKMIGTEPFWSLAVTGRTMTFELMDMPKVVQKTPRAMKTRYGRLYWTRRIQVAIVENQPCSDGMSDYIYRDDVKVTVDGRAFIGCGGPRHLPKGGSRP